MIPSFSFAAASSSLPSGEPWTPCVPAFFGATFLTFSDYMRPSVRLAALMGLPVTYLWTHDSIGLGEDGPTHQPVEQTMSLRLIPNLNVYRPADAIETAECWALALATPETPSVLALSRQNLPPVRRDAGQNRSARGAYRLRDATAARQVALVATGSEVAVALACAEQLEAQGIGADVVSMPCVELFQQQDAGFRAELLPSNVLKVSVEAGVTLGWERFVGNDGLTIGLDRFGASAPAEVLFKHFGFSAEAVVPKILSKLGK